MSGSSYTRAMFAGLQAGESDFQAIYGQVTSTISELDSQLRSGLAAWDGQARDAYFVAKAAWDAAEANMAATLANLRAVIGTANENYTSTEAANAQLWA